MPRKKGNEENPQTVSQHEIIQRPMDEVMHISMLPYAEHVILERALPRVEDGLKPVQRRILFTLHELGVTPDKPHKKCARIVGDCLGKYHPHGDSSVYDAMVRMAQPYSLRGLLVDGHGNFGSIDGDSAAAMRYTEARMAPLAMEMLRDLDKDTVPFCFNFDDSLKEPELLPSRYPNMLVNGASGIAVGLATNIPPHNLRETIDATLFVMEHPDASLDRVMKILPAPDFPTGGCLLDSEEIRTAYETGRGKLTLRARIQVEEGTAGRKLLVISEIPYGYNKAQILERIQKLTEEKKALFSGIYDIRDESDREGMRGVIELRKDVDPEVMLALLYKHSDLQVTFGVNMVAIAEGRPVQMGLIQAIRYYVDHQKRVITRRTTYELDQAKAREHILAGLMVAVNNLDAVIALIRASKTPKEAKEGLVANFDLDEIQAQAILDLRLQRLTGLELDILRKEYADILKTIKRLQDILNSEKKLQEVIRKEMGEIRDKYADERRTTIIQDDRANIPVVSEKPPAEDTVLLRYKDGQFRRVAPKVAEKIMGTPETAKEVAESILTMTDETAYIFTNLGNCYSIDLPKFPETTKPRERGQMLTSMVSGLEDGEHVVFLFCAKQEDREKAGDLLFVTRNGMVKRSPESEYILRRSRFTAVKFKGNDELAGMLRIPQDDRGDLILVTKRGFALRFPLAEIPTVGRSAAGVKGINVENGDSVYTFMKPGLGAMLFVLSERGFGKRMLCDDVDRQNRATKGQRVLAMPRSGEYGQELACFMITNGMDAVTVEQKHGSRTTVSLHAVEVERRMTKGKMIVSVLMDDIVVGVEEA